MRAIPGIVLLLATAPASAALFADYQASRHDRFLSDGVSANPDFLLEGVDLSGVGVGRNGGVLISDRHVLVANHFKGSSYSFVGVNGQQVSISPQSHTRLDTEVSSGTFLPSDLSIATLSRAITPADGLTPLPLFDGSADDIAGEMVHLYEQNDRLGRNIVEGGIISTTTGTIDLPPVGLFGNLTSNATWAIGYDFDLLHGVTDDEIGLVGGDSGHAALHIDDSGLVSVVGTHYAIVTSNGALPRDDGDRYISLSSFVTPYRSQIDAIIGDGGATSFAAIPEPTTGLVPFVGAMLLARRRR
ncbi:MAG: hypothetical protein AAF561_09880 [Planctomycetota bacterium]